MITLICFCIFTAFADHCSKHSALSPSLLCSNFYLSCFWAVLKNIILPLMLNITPITTAIMPQFIHTFIILMTSYRLPYLGTRLLWFNFTSYAMLQYSDFWPIMLNITYVHKNICAAFCPKLLDRLQWLLADGSKALSSSIIPGHSRETIVDVGSSITRLSSGDMSNYSIVSLWALWWSSKKKEYCYRQVAHIRWLTPSANLCHWTRHSNKPSWGCVIKTVHHTVKPKPYQWAAERVSSVVSLQTGSLNYLVTLTTLLL